MTQTEALKLADALNELLESFEKDGRFCKSSSIRNELYHRLKQTLEESKEALAQPEQGCCGNPSQCWEPCGELGKSEEHVRVAQPEQEPKCKTHPDAPHGFVRNSSHTQDRYVCECEYWEPPQPKEPEHEPVAVIGSGFQILYCRNDWSKGLKVGDKLYTTQHVVPLYTTPPQRKPLTDEQILTIARDHYNPHQRPEVSFARAIEAAHGIKE